MASKVTGQQTAVMVEDGYDFDQSGETYFETWRGNRTVILAKTTALRSAGYRVSRRKHNGPVYQVTGTISLAPTDGGGSGSEVPVDRYRIVTQTGLLDIRSNPKLITLAGTERTLAQWVKEIDAWFSDTAHVGAAYPGSWGASQVKVADLRARGATSYELKRPVLTRIRSFSTTYPNPFIMEGQPKVYTTAKLITTFVIPTAVANRLPTTPTNAPTNTTWAWLWTQQDSDVIPALNKVQEMDSWIFAAWSNSMYDVVS